MARFQFTNAITCAACGRTGQVRWEENSGANQRGPERTLIGVSAGFHQEPQQQQKSGDPAIICDGCGTLQQD